MATREQIQEYLFIRDNIDITVNAVLNKIVSIDIIPESEEKNMIKLTVETIEKKKEHLYEKALYEAAINDYRVTEHSNRNAVNEIAKKYKINSTDLGKEIYQHTVDSNYVYTVNIEGEYITYAQEKELWQYLKSLVERDFISCSCRVCFLLESSIHAYVFFKLWRIDQFYRQGNSHKAVTIKWIKKFEMRHRNEIDNLCSKLCNKSCSVVPVESVCSTSKSNK